jgi:alanine-synthesizing transaminase
MDSTDPALLTDTDLAPENPAHEHAAGDDGPDEPQRAPLAKPAIRLADRIADLPPYLFARINQLRDQKRQAGCDVIDMSMGNPSDPPATYIIEKLTESAQDPRAHGYAPSTGIRNLKRELAAKYLKKWGVRLDPDTEVVCTLGSKEGFGHLCLALIGPGDSAIVPAPSYPAHVYGVALASGRPAAEHSSFTGAISASRKNPAGQACWLLAAVLSTKYPASASRQLLCPVSGW